MDLNSTFISNIQDIIERLAKHGYKNLPTRIKQLEEKRGLAFLRAMPGLTYHFVGLVQIRDTNEVAVEVAVLKMAPTNESIEREARWLFSIDKGVAKIHWFDEEYHAYLMEQLLPGLPLASIVRTDDDKATRIICQVIRCLHTQQHKPAGFKHLSELASSLSILKGKVEDRLLIQAQTWFTELTSDRTNDVLLHGDLHHDNILSSGSGYKAIDPHGYIGDPAFAASTMIYNPGGVNFPSNRSLAQVIQRRMAILIDELPYDPKRLKAWAFCMTMLSMAWTVEDHGVMPEFELSVARIINKL